MPKQGDKKKLLILSYKNAMTYFHNKLKVIEKNADKRRNTRLLTQVKDDLGLKEVPYHIECFDNSNFQGSYAVSAIVVFKNGIPSKRDYRFFNVKTVEGPNDFATMREAVSRRYKRLLAEKAPLPQLIIIDGGKGQLSAAYHVLRELEISERVDIVGIAKKLEDIYKPGDPLPLSVNKKSQTLKLIQRARDEAHRFGITQHRKKRMKGTITTDLFSIKGVGAKTADRLLKEFKSIKKIREASLEELAAVIGPAKAAVVKASLVP